MNKKLKDKLSDAELDELANYLVNIDGAMNLEMVDGFFVALICAPDVILPSSYLPYVWGEDHEFETAEEAQKFISILMRHWNSIASSLANSDFFGMVLEDPDGDTYGNDWATGFTVGMKLGGDCWLDLIEESDFQFTEGLVPIFALANEHNPDSELPSRPIDSELRKKMTITTSVFVPKVYEYFHPQKPSSSKVAHENVHFPSSQRKIGRNEPCPCGSGLKYKKCC